MVKVDMFLEDVLIGLHSFAIRTLFVRAFADEMAIEFCFDC